MGLRTVAALALVLLLPALPGAAADPAPGSPSSHAASRSTAAPRPAVVERREIGRSVRGRPILAWRLGEPDAATRVVLLATMHGDEPAPRRILQSLRDGGPIVGLDLWVVPTYNPDGLARGTRTNARGVDLNRNFPHDWAPLDGAVESGPRPASEPETRAVMRFLTEVDPHRVLSFHQPLHGIDPDTKDPAFARRLARALRLPLLSLDCGSTCHGTLAMWFDAEFAGDAVTVEYAARESRHRMTQVDPRRILQVLDARRLGPR